MNTHIFWTALEQPGLEHLHLQENEVGILADGFILGTEDAAPFRLWYQVQIDKHWNVRQCTLQVGSGEILYLYSDGSGNWANAQHGSLPHLRGCLYIDITTTPFTNTLPLRHLSLIPGESKEIQVVYISIPTLDIQPVQQRYTCLSHTASGGIYRYESMETGFQADLLVDAQGIVLDYPGLWKQVTMMP